VCVCGLCDWFLAPASTKSKTRLESPLATDHTRCQRGSMTRRFKSKTCSFVIVSDPQERTFRAALCARGVCGWMLDPPKVGYPMVGSDQKAHQLPSFLPTTITIPPTGCIASGAFISADPQHVYIGQAHSHGSLARRGSGFHVCLFPQRLQRSVGGT
jgi:hypothetical protein